MLYLLIAIVILALLSFSEIFRNIVRWVIFIPLAALGVLIYNLLHIVENAINTLLSQFIPYIGAIDNAISLAIDLFIIYIITIIVVPNKKIGICISIFSSFIISLYNLINYASFVIVPWEADRNATISWGETGVLIAVFTITSYICYLSAEDED